jgi:quercetin dioxygenase-like cupin family protein
MGFWDRIDSLSLEDFRPGMCSRAELGEKLVMALMEIGPGKEDPGHQHPFEQCGAVIEGRIEMFVAEDRRVLGPLETYFIPAGVCHGWKTFDVPARILGVSSRQF